jgi:hypothetical protein
MKRVPLVLTLPLKHGPFPIAGFARRMFKPPSVRVVVDFIRRALRALLERVCVGADVQFFDSSQILDLSILNHLFNHLIAGCNATSYK